jgi:hypothetical protein
VVPHQAATVVFIQEGEHQVEGYQREPEYEDDEDLHEPYLIIKYAMKIIGAGRDKTFIHGGFKIKGTKEEGKKAELTAMTMKESSGHGLFAHNGLSFLCTRMTFTQCGDCGVCAYNTKGRLINCVITQCGLSGIYCRSYALIELEGDQTKVDGNGTCGYGVHYGLLTFSTSTRIHLLFPLTKESVSTNNHNGQNYGCHGINGASIENTIKTVDTLVSL